MWLEVGNGRALAWWAALGLAQAFARQGRQGGRRAGSSFSGRKGSEGPEETKGDKGEGGQKMGRRPGCAWRGGERRTDGRRASDGLASRREPKEPKIDGRSAQSVNRGPRPLSQFFFRLGERSRNSRPAASRGLFAEAALRGREKKKAAPMELSRGETSEVEGGRTRREGNRCCSLHHLPTHCAHTHCTTAGAHPANPGTGVPSVGPNSIGTTRASRTATIRLSGSPSQTTQLPGKHLLRTKQPTSRSQASKGKEQRMGK